MQNINRRQALLALPEKEKWVHVFTKLDEHEQKHDSHHQNFLECERKFQSTIAEIRSVSESQSKAIKAHAAASERRHQELMMQHSEMLDKLSGFISSAENLKKGVSFFAWMSDIIKSTLKVAGNVALVIGVAILFYLFVVQKINSDQLFLFLGKLTGVAK